MSRANNVNVRLTDKEYKKLRDYAEENQWSMSEAVRELIKIIPASKNAG